MKNSPQRQNQRSLSDLLEQVPEAKLSSEEKTSTFFNGVTIGASTLISYAVISAALDQYSAHSFRSAAKDIAKRLFGDPLSLVFAFAAGYFGTKSGRDDLKNEKRQAAIFEVFREANDAPPITGDAPKEPSAIGKHTAAVVAERSNVPTTPSRPFV